MQQGNSRRPVPISTFQDCSAACALHPGFIQRHSTKTLGRGLTELRVQDPTSRHCGPGWTNPTLLGITHQYASEYPGYFTSCGFSSEMHQDLPGKPPQSGYRNTHGCQCGLPPGVLGVHTLLACHRTRSRLPGLIGYLWAKEPVQSLYTSLPFQRPQHLPQMQPRALNPRTKSRLLNSYLWVLTPEWSCGQHPYNM